MRRLLPLLTILFLAAAPLPQAFAQEFALDAPAAVTMRARIPVGWTTPSPKGGIIEIRPTGPKARRVAYAYTIKNPQPVEAPETPGDYVLVLKFKGEDRVSQPLRVEPASATLSAAAQADAGAALSVTWDGPNSRNDHVTFAEPGGPPIRGTSYAYTGNSRDGTIKLRAPQDTGRYDIVYVTGKTVIARAPVTVGSIAATLDLPAEVTAGSRLAVAFDGPDNQGDRITFAARDGAPISPASYGYTGNAKDGRVTLTAFEEPGSYDVVYLSGGRVIGRAPVEILPVAMTIDAPAEVPALLLFEIAWQGGGNQGDRIVMVQPGESDSRHYRYIDPAEPAVAMHAPGEPGPYELVYLTRGGKELARRTITITPAPLDPGQIEVPFAPAAVLGPEDAVGVILDASGSMLKRQGGERRIAIARRVLTGLVTETIPPGTGFALRVFGNRAANACRTDLEIPLGPNDPAKATAVIATINAVNLAKTPIAESVALAASDLAGASGSRVLILITDGEETCGGNPGAAIEALRAGGVDVRVNIVGYAIGDAALAHTFKAWAAAGGGAYFDAANASELSAALVRATASPFQVIDTAGGLVATGLTGDPPQTIPAGAYTVRIGSREHQVEVKPRKLTRLTP